MRLVSMIALVLFIGTLTISSCSKQVEPGTEKLVSVDLYGCAPVFLNENVKICLDSVLEDSRCPANAMCIWQGMAIVKFSFSVNNAVYPVTLSTLRIPGFFDNTAVLAGHRIEFLDLHPYPGLPNPAPGIKADVKVTKL